MIRKILNILILLFLIMFILSCEKGHRYDCLKGKGEDRTEKRIFSYYHTLKIEDSFDIIFVNDSVNYIEIQGGDKIIPGIITELNDSVLTVSNTNKCNWVRDYDKIELLISFNDLDTLFINGECNISSLDSLKTEMLYIGQYSSISRFDLTLSTLRFYYKSHSGTGEYYFRGKTSRTYYYFHGSGEIHAKDFISNYCGVNHNSIADFTVYCTIALDGEICNKGNLKYYGNPSKVKVDEYSSGKLIKMD